MADSTCGVFLPELRDDAIGDALGWARVLQLRRSSIRLALRKGLLPRRRRAGRYWLIGADIRAWLLSAGDQAGPAQHPPCGGAPTENGRSGGRVRKNA